MGGGGLRGRQGGGWEEKGSEPGGSRRDSALPGLGAAPGKRLQGFTGNEVGAGFRRALMAQRRAPSSAAPGGSPAPHPLPGPRAEPS